MPPSFPPGESGSPAASLPGLLVRSGEGEYRLRPGTTYRIGRDPTADVVIEDPRVSWTHARLGVDAAGWVLTDLNSSNGVFLGGQRVEGVGLTGESVIRLADAQDGPVLHCIPERAAAVVHHGPPPEDLPSLDSAPATTEWTATSGPSVRLHGMASAGPPEPRIGGVDLPRVDVSPTSTIMLTPGDLRIGRADDNDLVLADVQVSRHHAQLRRLADGGYTIVDLGSSNGTYVNGSRIQSHPLGDSDIVGIGRSTFRLSGGQLRHHLDTGDISVKVHELFVTVASGTVLLDRVTFAVPERCLLGVIGPSGAGKSTLLGALTGMRPADTGNVLYDNRDLYRNLEELRSRIGLVPQENILHLQLTARRALQYSAELRLPADTSEPERDARVDEVLAELGLTRHAGTRNDRLSGGQLKRVNVAQELLTKPSLLLLDEPTSGLDPGLDQAIMRQLRDLAHDGRTVVVVTHSMANLDACDRLLVLAPGGKLAFYGPPGEALGYFGLPGWAELFQAFERWPDRAWGVEFAASPAYAQWAAVERPEASAQPDVAELPAAPPARRSRRQQLATLTRRYAQVIASDRGYLIFLGLLPLVLGLLLRFVPAKEGLAGAPGTNLTAPELLQILVTCACLAGTATSVRELVKERPIYRRERAAGLSSTAYLLSKVVVLGAITVVQSVVIVLLGVAGRTMPAHGAWLAGQPLLELLIAITALSLASVCLGLLVSAFVGTSERAMPILVMLIMGQIILSGGVLPLAGLLGLSQLSWIAASRWGFSAVASTVDLNVVTPGSGDPLWRHGAESWLRDVGLMTTLAAAYLLAGWVRLRRLGQARRGS
ncbi:MAG: transporter ATP-binding/permease protein [Frankiales bacterium]|nr:transporter ATP-binding/permease protein [Frankiales bacterium]